MKKFLLAHGIALCLFCASCAAPGGPSATAKKNLDAMHGVQNSFDSKDFSKLGDYIAEDAVDHSSEQGDIKGLANMKTEFEKWSAAVDNPKTEITKELADDEYVMSWNHYTGTTKVAQMGLKAGDHFDMHAIEVARFKDGKAVEHWSYMDPAEMMKMMPQMPPPAVDPTIQKDTAKKM